MIVPEILAVGSILIQTRLLILILSILFAYYVVRWKLARIKELPLEVGGKLLDKFMNAVIIAIVIWKFTPVIRDPSIIWTKPLSILTYTGGTMGILYGTLAGLLYAVVALWRARLLAPLALDVLASCLILVLFPYRLLFWEYGTLTDLPWGIALTDSLLRYHPVNLYAGVISAVVILYVLLSKGSRFGTAAIARDSMLGLGLGWFAVTFFKRSEVTFLLTTEQWLLLALAAAGMLMPSIAKLMTGRIAERAVAPLQETVVGREDDGVVESSGGGEDEGTLQETVARREDDGVVESSGVGEDEGPLQEAFARREDDGAVVESSGVGEDEGPLQESFARREDDGVVESSGGEEDEDPLQESFARREDVGVAGMGAGLSRGSGHVGDGMEAPQKAAVDGDNGEVSMESSVEGEDRGSSEESDVRAEDGDSAESANDREDPSPLAKSAAERKDV